MQNADTAMFHAKASGRDNDRFFRTDMNVSAVCRMAIESRLRHTQRQEQV